jgi:hypothetical protein
MNKQFLTKITNNFQDVRLVSLASWRKASEIEPRDRNGPYVVTQEGYDPEDVTLSPDEFVLGRSGKWLSIAYFYQMPVPERRAEFVFGTAAEVMRILGDLPSKVAVMRPGGDAEKDAAGVPEDEMTAAFKAARGQGASPAAG